MEDNITPYFIPKPNINLIESYAGSYDFNISDQHIPYSQLPGHTGLNDCRSQPGNHLRETSRGNTLQSRNMDTPATHTQVRPRKLFDKDNNPNSLNIGVEGINMEFLLLTLVW